MANVKGNTEAEKKRARLQARHRKAAAARRKLVATAAPIEGQVRLDPAVLLGTSLLTTPNRYIGLRSEDGHDQLFLRSQLREARVALLRVFEDLTVAVDDQGLHFRWRGGLGGWDLPQAGPMQHDVERGGKFCVRIPGLIYFDGCRKVA
jgi:hypothetical protein